MATTSTGRGEPARLTAPSTAAGVGPARVEPPVPPGSVVLAVPDADLDASSGGLALALQEARRRRAPLVVLHASGGWRELSPGSSWTDEQRAEHGRHVVGLVAQHLRRMSRFEVDVVAVSSILTAVDALLAASQRAAMLVLQVRPGRHVRLAREPGHTVRAVASRAACPVLVLHGNDARLHRRGVVVGVEEHGRAQSALRVAMEEAAAAGVPVTAVHAFEVPGPVQVPPTPGELAYAHEAAQLLLAEALAGLAEDYPTVTLHRRAFRGPAADVLRATASTAGVLVVARRGAATGGLHTLGRTARALLHASPCPVMVTPPARRPPRRRGAGFADVPIGAGY